LNVAQGIAEILKREGVDLIFGYPVNPVLESCAARDIRPIIVRQERTGLHMADALARVSSGRRIGVFAMQHGPGTENAFGGVAQAFSESVPLLVLPAGYPRRLAQIPPNFSAVQNFQHVTKWRESLQSGRALGEVMRRAFAQLRSGRLGPVLVEIPVDVYGEDIGESIEYTPTRALRSGPDPDAVREVAQVLRQAERPVIYAGQGVHWAQAWSELRELAELLHAPVVTSLSGKSAFPEDHPLALGTGGRAVPRPVKSFLAEADLIFGIGCSFTRTAFGVGMPAGKRIVHATLDAADVHKDVRAEYALVGDAALTLRALVAELKETPGPHAEARAANLPQRIRSVRESWLAEWAPRLRSDEIPLSPYRVIDELARIAPIDRTIITHDAGSPRDQLTPFWRSTLPLSYLGWGKTTQLGYGLGLAMGAKLAHPDRLCINVWGDAAIGFTGMDFETAVRERIPILSILLNNFCMAIELPVMPVSTAKYRSTDISGHYADFARALGGYGERVTEPGQIAAALRRGIEATESGTPALLEFITAQELAISQG
jgi:acetolactate synthase-1/2/3 large subunit